ncbi:MAG: peptidoglycan DD-metalloendopeptidase family protein [bacterium]|nr:peptidoglycan DD-metalloendopeptidase family protein [bacterium]
MVIFTLITFSYPVSAHAGILSGFFNFLSGAGTQNAQSAAVSAPLPLLASQQNPSSADDSNSDQAPDDTILLQVTDDAALVAPRNPIGVYADTHDQIFVYEVKSGDSPDRIAKRFGISLNTLLWANDLRSASLIRVGDELVILPVSGVQYQVKRGDTIESIAKKFKSKDGDLSSVVTDILQFNGLAVNERLEEGSTIIIPDGEMIITAPAQVSSKSSTIIQRTLRLPEYIGYFLRPVLGGYNPRARQANHGIHGYNGVDISVDYGTPVMASAGGTIVVSRSTGWNGGYGKYVVISHPNGTQTLYAHMSSALVQVGQRVVQGATIGYVGSTGNSTGPHVHFEIRGAANPFWK